MILYGSKIRLVPILMHEDWVWVFNLAIDKDPRLTMEILVRNVMIEGFQFYIAYEGETKLGVVFSQHYRNGLTIDGYVDSKKLTGLKEAKASMESALLMMDHLFKFTDTIYIRAGLNDKAVNKLCNSIGMKKDHETSDFLVWIKKRPESWNANHWDSSMVPETIRN